MDFGQGILGYLSENFVLLVALTGVIYLFSLPNHVIKKERINLITSVVICLTLSIVAFIFTNYGAPLPTWIDNLLFFFICFGTPFISYFYFFAISGLKVRYGFLALLIINGGILVTGLLGFPITYSIDSTGIVTLGPLFYISIALVVALVFSSFVYGIVKKSKDKIFLSSFILAVTCATIAVVAFNGSIGVIYTVSVIYASFCYAYKFYIYNAYFQVQEIKKKQIALAVSQIQPHFIFNALNSIYALIDVDVLKARKLLNDFSTYLRVNIDSLSSSEPVDFARELDHIESYVRIEKIRFGNRLNVIYDIKFNNFKIAPLTLQPLVENAIRHGICVKKEGGTVFIRTNRVNDYVEIIIEDNGVGFDINKEIDTNVHTGFTNVKDRVEGLYKGHFEYFSEVGLGTKIRILLPIEN